MSIRVVNDEPKLPGAPYDEGAEKAVLASCLADPETILHIAPILEAGDFMVDRHKILYAAMLRLHHKHMGNDLISVKSELRAHNQLDAAGGVAYISTLFETGLSPLMAEGYAQRVLNAATKRQLLKIGGQIAGLAYEQDDAPMLVEDAGKLMQGLYRRQGAGRVKDALGSLNMWRNEMDARLELGPGQIAGLRSGFGLLDKMTGGLRKKRLYIVAARPGVGKSSFMLNVGREICKAGGRVLIFSLEMSTEELISRWISDLANVNSTKLEAGTPSDHELMRVSDAEGKIGDWDFHIDETGGLSITELSNRARAIAARKRIDFIAVDHLQLMQGGKSENRNVDLGAVSYGLKMLAKELDLSILALSQLSRKSEERSDHMPMLSDLRESGNLEQDADAVLFLHREELYKPNDPTLKGKAIGQLAKNRSGPTGQFSMMWQGQHTRFVDVTNREYEA